MKAIIFSLVAALGFGIAGPFIKTAMNKGMHADGFLFSYGLSMIMISLLTVSKGGLQVLFPNTPALWYGLLAGTFCALGAKSHAEAFAIPTSLVAIVAVLGATFPLISSAISLPLMGEAEKITVTKFLTGAVMIVAGGYLVSTSIK